MDWSNERYVRVYTRDTTTWKLMDWRGRTVLSLLIRKVDRAGVLDVGDDGVLGLAAVLELPLDITEAGIAQLTTARGNGLSTVVYTGNAYVIPNFLEAQEAPQSDPQRKRESRGRRRDMMLASSRKPPPMAGNVTGGHETGRQRDENTEAVTPILSEPSRAEPSRSDQSADQPDTEPPRTTKYDPESAAQRGALGEETYERVCAAHAVVCSELGLSARRPLPKLTPSARPQAWRELMERIREEGADAPEICARVVESLTADCRAQGDPSWLGAKSFGPGVWAHAREQIPGWARPRAGPQSSQAPPVRRFASSSNSDEPDLKGYDLPKAETA